MTSRFVLYVAAMIVAFLGLGVALVACGDAEVDQDDTHDWFVTTDPYGDEFACLVVSNGTRAGGGMFCTPKP